MVSPLRLISLCWLNIQNSHHALVFMIEDVAVVHSAPDEILKADSNGDRFIAFEGDGVFPSQQCLGLAVPFDDLKAVGMQMEGMIHAGFVDNAPVRKVAKL